MSNPQFPITVSARLGEVSCGTIASDIFCINELLLHDSDVPAVSIEHNENASFGDTKLGMGHHLIITLCVQWLNLDIVTIATITGIHGDSPKTPSDAIENDMWQAAMNKPDDMHESMVISKARYETTPDSSGSDSIVSTPQDTSPVDEHVKQQVSMSSSFSDSGKCTILLPLKAFTQ